MNGYGAKFGEFYYMSHDGIKAKVTTFYVSSEKIVLEVGNFSLEDRLATSKLMSYEEGIEQTEAHLEKIRKNKSVIVKAKSVVQE